MTARNAGSANPEVQGRPIILTFVGHYLPGYRAGGPARTIVNMVEQLGEAFDFRIVAKDRDLGDTEPYPGLIRDHWTDVGKARVFYRSPGSAAWRALLCTPEARTPELIYLNSFFGLDASLRPLWHRRLGRFGQAPVLLAPRGEFSAGALALKPFKKRAFITLSRILGLHRSVTFQASSKIEADDIKRALGTVPVVVAMDLSARSQYPIAPRHPSRLSESLKVVFLSRISPKKNLLGALAILGRVGSTAVHFDIFGVIEDRGYWSACEAAISRMPDHVRVQYRGPVHPDKVEAVLGDYDIFLLPTLGENYGHVIREALSAGVPVLISDQTPWRGLAARAAGADLPLCAPDAFANWIEAFARLSETERDGMRLAARALGDDPIAAEVNLQANYDMLLAALRQTV